MAPRCPVKPSVVHLPFRDTFDAARRSLQCQRQRATTTVSFATISHFAPPLQPTLQLRCKISDLPATHSVRFCHDGAGGTQKPSFGGRENASSVPSVEYPESRLNPHPDDYAAASFSDKALLTMHAGPGGHGCISFLREIFIPDGPPNGGDGGHGGNIYIQALPGETSLHKLARRRVVRAGRGKHGQGSARNGQRGDDLIISVPVGTVVKELSRTDPVADEANMARAAYMARKLRRQAATAATASNAMLDDGSRLQQEMKSPWQLQQEENERKEREEKEAAELEWARRKWLVYPGLSSSQVKNIEYPRLPRRDRLFHQPTAPIFLDLSQPTPQPILLATGGVGGLGNQHFVSRQIPRPVVATKGGQAVSLTVQLELKLLADVGLVGLPNAGKSTLLRALSNSRARVGSWAFTTLQPNIGTVVLDNNSGRPLISNRHLRGRQSMSSAGKSHVEPGGIMDDGDSEAPHPRTRFTVADIPGLVEGAHMDKGLGIAFLRHIERAGLLAFVVDLGAGDAIAALKALWKEVGLYARLRMEEEQQRVRVASIDWDGLSPPTYPPMHHRGGVSEPSPELAIAGKPWFVVATKGDLPGAEANFSQLRNYLDRVTHGDERHPSEVHGAWTQNVAAIPVSAINGHGVNHVIHWTVGLLDL